jgi:hypothetical protein
MEEIETTHDWFNLIKADIIATESSRGIKKYAQKSRSARPQ